MNFYINASRNLYLGVIVNLDLYNSVVLELCNSIIAKLCPYSFLSTKLTLLRLNRSVFIQLQNYIFM